MGWGWARLARCPALPETLKKIKKIKRTRKSPDQPKRFSIEKNVAAGLGRAARRPLGLLVLRKSRVRFGASERGLFLRAGTWHVVSLVKVIFCQCLFFSPLPPLFLLKDARSGALERGLAQSLGAPHESPSRRCGRLPARPAAQLDRLGQRRRRAKRAGANSIHAKYSKPSRPREYRNYATTRGMAKRHRRPFSVN